MGLLCMYRKSISDVTSIVPSLRYLIACMSFERFSRGVADCRAFNYLILKPKTDGELRQAICTDRQAMYNTQQLNAKEPSNSTYMQVQISKGFSFAHSKYNLCLFSKSMYYSEPNGTY